MAASVWSASDASVNGMTLTNGGLTVTPSGSTWQSIRTSSSKTSGQFYIEFANSGASSTADLQFGLASSGFNPSSYLGSSIYSGGAVINSGGNVVSDGFTAEGTQHCHSPQEPIFGDVFSLAVDFTTGSMWLGYNNVWLGGSNPATGSLPVISFVPATVGALFAGIAIYGANHGVWTLQATAASQKYAPPAGFSAWDAPAGVTTDLAGNLAPAVSFAANLTIIPAPAYIDFTGNLGSPSSYGKLAYGQKHYSRGGPFAPIFAGNLDIVGQDFFAGDLRPVVTFSGALSIMVGSLAGDLAPVVTFAGDLTLVPSCGVGPEAWAPVVTFAADLSLVIGLAGDLAPQIDLGASLTFDLPLTGDLPFQIAFAGSELTAGPLWASSEPCPAPPWSPSEPCPPSMWTPTEPCDPVEWTETEKCNG